MLEREIRNTVSASRLRLADVFISPEHTFFVRRSLGLFDNARAGRKVYDLLPSRGAHGSPGGHGAGDHVVTEIKNALVPFNAEAGVAWRCFGFFGFAVK